MDQQPELHYFMADPSQPDPENPITTVVPQLDSIMLVPDPEGKFSGTSGTRKYRLVLRDKPGQEKASIEVEDLILMLGAIEDAKRWSQLQPSISLELCWTDKLAELKAKLPEVEYERLMQFMKDPRLHKKLMDGHSWRLDPTSYPYTPLRGPSKDTFRLLMLMPATDKNSPIKCTLVQDLIENKSPYEALSYVWGTGISEIQVNERRFPATKNLEAALRALRLRKSMRVLWVDAICINQYDPLEKQTQVQMMAQIYNKATNVLIWLGNETNAALKAFAFLEWISSMVNPHYKTPSAKSGGDRTAAKWDLEELTFDQRTLAHIVGLISSRKFDHHLECVATILRKPYWGRIWVLQEVVMARLATVICGSLFMEWSQFSFCVERAFFFCQSAFLNAPLSDGHISSLRSESPWVRTRAEGGILRLPYQSGVDARRSHAESLIPRNLPHQMLYMRILRERRLKEYPLKMSTLLQATRDRASGDPRDKVYALLGMVDTSMSKFNTPIIPDYSISYPKVCTKLAVKFLLSRMDLAILEDLDDPIGRTVREVPPRDIHLPSWVPDFGNMSDTRSLDCLNWKLNEDPLFYELQTGNQANMLDSGALWRRAFNASAHASSRFPYTFSSDLKICTLTGIAFDTVEAMSCCIQGGASESRKFCLREWQNLVKTKFRDEYPRGGINYKEAYWRTTFCNIYWPDSILRPFSELPSVISGNIHIPPTSEEEEQRLIDLICSWSRESTAQLIYRTVFLTHSGLLGLGPASMRPGDALAVLMGGRVPIVLRQSNDNFQHDNTKSGIYYQVIGESYVHGVMQGEIVREEEDGLFKMGKFQLV